MKGIDIQEFYNELYYGCEIFFCLNATRYMVESHTDNGNYCIILHQENNGNDEIIYNEKSTNIDDVISHFMKSKNFDGKNIYGVEKEIEIIDIY